MKKKIKKQPQAGGKKCTLTVGMIVKNEEKYLRQCLEALRPAVDAVGGEIIVTDTGSTDGTVAIAQELADKVLHFEWCDDFAAARNTAFRYARGKWFMYLDADEILDADLSALVDFFQKGKEKSYNSASFMMYNYTTGEEYVEFRPMRLFRMRDGIQFKGRIHENIQAYMPLYDLPTVVHHYGYVGMGAGQQEEKVLRNREILQNQPETVLKYMQLADTYPTEPEKRWECLVHARQMADQEDNDVMRVALYVVMARAAYWEWDENEVREVCDSYWAGKKTEQDFASEIELLLYDARDELKRENYEAIRDKLERYMSLLARYEAGQLNTLDTHVIVIAGWRRANYYNGLELLLTAYEKLKEKEKIAPLLATFDAVDAAKENKLDKVLPAVLRGICWLEDEAALERLYGAIQTIDGGCDVFEKHFPIILELPCASKPWIYAAIAQAGGDRPLDLLCRLAAIRPWDETVARDIVGRLEEVDLGGNALGGIALDAFLRLEEEGNTMLRRFPQLGKCLRFACTAREEFADTVCRWLERRRSDALSLPVLQWRVELAALTLMENKQAAAQEELFAQLTMDLEQLCGRLYQPEACLAENRSVLPALHQAAFYAAEAVRAKRQDDPVGYLKGLKAAAECYPLLSASISAIADRVNERLKEQNSAQNEFQMLAQKIKEQVRGLIAQGELEEAEKALESYRSVNPDDPETETLLAMARAGQSTHLQ